MNLAQLRKSLRSKIRDLDTANPDWNDSDLNLVLAESALSVQDFVNGIDPNPYTITMYNDLVAGQYRYALPASYRSPGIREVAIKSASSSAYTPMGRQENVDLDESRAGTNAITPINRPPYSINFGALELLNVPTANVTAGLRIIFSSTIAMDDDDAIPQLPLSLHSCIVLEAALTLAPDTDDPDFEKYLKILERKYTTFAKGFKIINNRDQMGITQVGGHDRMSWGTPPVGNDTSYPRRM